VAITVTSLTRVAGLHYWPGAPAGRAYLGQPHRHVFWIRATVTVDHAERDVEFHDLGSFVTNIVNWLAPPATIDKIALRDFGPRSCETIATHVAERLRDDHHLDVVSVSCSEDDEFTATWTKD
jgi:hypothetical protein